DDTNDIVGGLNDVLTKDGQNTPTANLPMGGFRHTNVHDAVARTDYASAGQVQDGGLIWNGVTGGSANAQTLGPSPSVASLVDGQVFNFRAGFTNTGATTFAVGGLPTQPVTFRGVPLEGNDLVAGQNGSVSWNAASSRFELAERAQPLSDVRTGVVSAFAGSSAPEGYLMCDGSAVSRSTFAALFAVISTIYGSGDGTTTFNVPDTRGRIVAGFDASNATGRLTAAETGGASAAALGNSGGEQGHTILTAELAAHNHGVVDPQHNHTVSDSGHLHGAGSGAQFAVIESGAANVQLGSTYNIQAASNTAGATTGIGLLQSSTGISISNAGSGSAHNNVQPTLILNYIIKT